MKTKNVLVDGEYGLDAQKKYAGKWVAMLNGKILAAGETVNEVMRAIEKLKLKEPPLVTKVIRPDEAMCVL